MSKLPLRRPSLLRSLTFWSGVVVIGFLLWAWWDSSWRWVYQRADSSVLDSHDSGLSIYHDPDTHFGWENGVDTAGLHLSGSRLLRPRLARPGFAKGLPELPREEDLAQLRSGIDLAGRPMDPVVTDFYRNFHPGIHGPRSWFLFIPYWCVLLPAVTLWLGLIYGRHRRIARHLSISKPEASTPAE